MVGEAESGPREMPHSKNRCGALRDRRLHVLVPPEATVDDDTEILRGFGWDDRVAVDLQGEWLIAGLIAGVVNELKLADVKLASMHT